MAVQVDWDGLLASLRDPEATGDQPLAFVVEEAGGTLDPLALLDLVRSAVWRADELAERRVPDDPTGSSGGDLVGNAVWAELDNGLFTEQEVRAWFADLVAGLERAAAVLTVAAAPATTGVPQLDDWLNLPAAITAFCVFTPEIDRGLGLIPREAVHAVADDLAQWCRLPGATTVVNRGSSEFVIPQAAAATEMRLGADLEEPFSVSAVVTAQPRGRLVRVGHEAGSYVQVVDPARSLGSTLRDLLEPLRILGPHLEYAWVRPAMTLVPSPRDVWAALGRATTRAEDEGSGRPALLRTHVIDAWVAQVLSEEHLSRLTHLDSFSVEDLPNRRHLVVAKDPDTWLVPGGPPTAELEEARLQFGDALLTDEVIDRHIQQLLEAWRQSAQSRNLQP